MPIALTNKYKNPHEKQILADALREFKETTGMPATIIATELRLPKWVGSNLEN